MQQVLELDADYADARFYLALNMRATNRREEAKEMLELACALDRENSNYHKWLGLIFMETGDLVAALEYTKTALELDGDDVTAYVQLGGISCALEDLVLAEKALRSGLDINPEDIRCRAELAGVLIETDQFEAAKKELDTLESKGGREHGIALSSLALFESFKGDEQKALDLIENAMEIDGKSIDVLLRSYKIFTKLSDPSKANRVLDALQDIAPDDSRVMGLLLA